MVKSRKSFCGCIAGSLISAVTPSVSERVVYCTYKQGKALPSSSRSIAMSYHMFPSTNTISF